MNFFHYFLNFSKYYPLLKNYTLAVYCLVKIPFYKCNTPHKQGVENFIVFGYCAINITLRNLQKNPSTMKTLICKVIGHNWSRTRRKISTKSRRKRSIDVKNQWHQKCLRCNNVRAVNVREKSKPVFIPSMKQLQQQGA